MGKLTRAHLIETAVWLAIASLGYYYSFAFNGNIEIYKFGASGWPRAVLALIVFAALGNLVWHYYNGDNYGDIIHQTEELVERIAHAQDDPGVADTSNNGSTPAANDIVVESPLEETESRRSYLMRIVPIIVLPFLYGYFLEGIGFYSLTPPFIAIIIFVMGERSVAWITGITGLIYGLLLFLFAKILFVGLPVGNWHPFYDFSQWLIPVIQDNYLLEFIGLAVVIPLAIFALTRAKGTTQTAQVLTRAAIIYTALLTLGTLAAYLLGGRSKMFILLEVFKWPLSLIT